jgi:prepilin-type processing-associated H-X9-DG protein
MIDAAIFGVTSSAGVASQMALVFSALSYQEGVSLLNGPLGDHNSANDYLMDKDLDDPTKVQLISALSQPAGHPIGNGNGNIVYRLREGIERFLITDINAPAASATAQSQLPVMWDVVSTTSSGRAQFNHLPGGANTLYMDGHVEFNKYPSRFPASDSFATVAGFF